MGMYNNNESMCNNVVSIIHDKDHDYDNLMDVILKYNKDTANFETNISNFTSKNFFCVYDINVNGGRQKTTALTTRQIRVPRRGRAANKSRRNIRVR